VLNNFSKTHITLAAAATAIIGTAVLMSPSSDVEAKRMSYAIELDGNGSIEGRDLPALD